MLKIGDIVTNSSYGDKVLFRVSDIIDENTYALYGIEFRLVTHSRAQSLEQVTLSKVKQLKRIFKEDLSKKVDEILKKRYEQFDFDKTEVKPGKVLHIDADREYLKMCMSYYEMLGVTAIGENISEKEQSTKLKEILKSHMPDILVITGHDSLSDKGDKDDIENYISSGYFIESTKMARWVNPSKDSLIIIAGACQSYYEGLIEAGANIASSPERILIHALDPVFAAEKVSFTPVGSILSLEQILENTITGVKGMGGFQVRGVLREGKGKIKPA